MKKLIVLILTAAMLLMSMAVVPFAEEEGQLILERDDESFVAIDFNAENETEGDVFLTNAEMQDYLHLGLSFINPATFYRYTESGAVADGTSMQLKDFADIRVWSLNVTGRDGYALDMTVKVDSLAKGGYFELCVTDGLIQETHNESEGGYVWYMQVDDSGELGLYDHSQKKLRPMEFGKTYNITFFVAADESEYTVFVDGEAAGKCNFPGEVTLITAFRIDLRGTGLVTMDDIILDGAYTRVKKTATAIPATEAPTEVPATEDTATDAPAATAPVESAGATGEANNGGNSSTDSSKNSGGAFPVVWIAVGAVLIIAAVAAVILAKKKKK